MKATWTGLLALLKNLSKMNLFENIPVIFYDFNFENYKNYFKLEDLATHTPRGESFMERSQSNTFGIAS